MIGARQYEFRESAFVGRTNELSRLSAHYRHAQAGRGDLVLLEAESGGGKSRLLNEFSRSIGARIFLGQASAGSGAKPAALFSGVFERVLAVAREDRIFASRLRAALAGRESALVALFPNLAFLFPNARQEQDKADEGDEGAVRALSAALAALGSKDEPVVVLLDDCQWADELALRALRYWTAHSPEEGLFVTVVAAYRAGELADGSPLRAARAAELISLSSIDQSGLRSVLESMGGVVSDEALSLIRRLSGDNLFMVTAVFRGLVESGALVFESGFWNVPPQDGEAPAPASDDNFLRRRIELLESPAIALLKAAAVIGKEFHVADIAEIGGRTPQRAELELVEALRRGILAGAERGKASFAHDRLRDAVLTMLSEEERRALHLAAARRFDSAYPGRSFDISFHYYSAGRPDLALPHAVAAAEDSRKRHALQAAETQYRMALEAADAAPAEMRRTILYGLAEVSSGRGKYEEALELLQQALELAPSEVERARVYLRIGLTASNCGRTTRSIEAFESGLALMQSPVPSGSFHRAFVLVKGALVQALHSLFPGYFLGRKAFIDRDRELLVADLRLQYGYPIYFECRIAEFVATHLQTLNRLERFEPTEQLAFCYASHAILTSNLAWDSRAIAYGRRALEIRLRLGDEWAIGNSYHFLAIAYLTLSRFEDVLDVATRALTLFERLGYRWEEDIVRCNLAYALYRLGDLRGAEREARRTFEDGIDIGDLQGVTPALSAWAKAMGGAVPEEFLDRAEARLSGTDVQTVVEARQARAIWHLGRGEADRAAELLTEAWNLFRASGVVQEFVVGTLPWLLTAERMRVELLGDGASAADRKRLDRATKAALRSARRFKNNLPHVLRELAIIRMLEGREAGVRELLTQSLDLSNAQRARYERAQTMLWFSRAARQFNWEGVPLEAEAARELEAVGANLAFHGVQGLLKRRPA